MRITKYILSLIFILNYFCFLFERELSLDICIFLKRNNFCMIHFDRLFVLSESEQILYHGKVCNKQYVYCNNKLINNSINCNAKFVNDSIRCTGSENQNIS